MTNFISITEINKIINDKLENIGEINIKGEVSAIKISKNHGYMTLIDKLSTINCIIWSYIKKKKINIGTIIEATGYLNVYSKNGSFSFVVNKYNEVDTGNIVLEYNKRKEFYESNGFFNKKRKLHGIIKKIGILTSKEGAALQDIFYVLKNKKFLGKTIVKNCNVQGKDCATSVVDGLKELDKLNLDVIIISRGGGSFDDLYGFSDCKVIEQIYATKTITISAIGHEVDFMLSDFVADIRCPTPSLAAELVATTFYEKIHKQKEYSIDLHNKINSRLNILYNKLINIHIPKKSQLLKSINDKYIYQSNILRNDINKKIHQFEKELEKMIPKYDKNIRIFNNNNDNNNELKTIEDFNKIGIKNQTRLKIITENGTILISMKILKIDQFK